MQKVVGLVVAVALAAGSIGYAVGVRSDGPPGAASVDVGFLWDMLAHHEQAIVMSQFQIAQGVEPRVSHFAREIVQSQSYEIGLMEAYLGEFGQPRERTDHRGAMGWMGHAVATDAMPGMASETQLDFFSQLDGRDADAMFLALMQAHHRGGVHMAEDAAQRADDAEVRELAARIARNQLVETRELEAVRVALGLPVPANVDPDPALPD